ncbi:MAG TPA: FAD-dependent oxidoreductase [Pseudonocardia sp.]|nr:FAD-dependent oxidoreductase [Pseudonocardia sp.]
MADQVDAVVVGAGISGLASALELQRRGWRVAIVAERPAAASTSYLAAAVWFPTRAGPRDKVLDWGARTYAVLADQATQGVPGIVMRESLMLYREPPDEPWWAPAVGGVRLAEPAELPPGYRFGLRFVVPLAEMPAYLPWLVARFEANGGRFEYRRLGSLAELTAPVVINCAGLGARELVGDLSVVPVRGQIVRVTNPGLRMSVRDEDHPGGRAYVHPRDRDCILGGTLDEGSWDDRVDPATSSAILARCRDLVPALADAEVLEHIVGLRPARPDVRLEVDPDPAAGGVHPGRATRVIHNYGHGGSGITLSWGCAEQVAELAAAY